MPTEEELAARRNVRLGQRTHFTHEAAFNSSTGLEIGRKL